MIKFLNILCFKISDGISILVEMQNKSMSVRGWVRMMKDEPEVLEPFSIRGCFVVVVFVCDDALFLMRPLCFMLSFLIRLPADPNVRTEPQSDIGRNRGKKRNLSALEQCAQKFSMSFKRCWLAPWPEGVHLFRGTLCTAAGSNSL